MTTGVLVALFGYAVGTLEYWLADETPSPDRWDLARFAVPVVGVRLYASEPMPESNLR